MNKQITDQAYDDLVLGDFSAIKEGSHQFKRRFIDISRAGNKMINIDMTAQVDHNNSLRAFLRNKVSEKLLSQLLEVAAQRDADEGVEQPEHAFGYTLASTGLVTKPAATFTNTTNSTNTTTMMTRSINAAHLTDTTHGDLDSKPTSPSVVSTSSTSTQPISETDVEIALTLNSKNVTYQDGSQAFQIKSRQKGAFMSAESEIALEVVRCIESREKLK